MSSHLRTPLEIIPMPLTPAQIDTLQALCEPFEWEGKPGQHWQPQTAEQTAHLLRLAGMQHQSVSLSQRDAARMKHPVWLDLSALNRVRHYRIGDLTITVEAGMSIRQLQEVLAAQGHYFPLSYPDRWLLTDILAEDAPALESGIFGYPRDYVLATEIATPDGRVTKYGAEVVKNVTGYDLNKLYVGSHHSLGVLTTVTLKVLPAPGHVQAFQALVSEANRARVMQALRQFSSGKLPICEWVYSDRPAEWQLFLTIQSAQADALSSTVIQPVKELLPMLHALSEEDWLAQQQLLYWIPSDAIVVELAYPVGQTEDLLTQYQALFHASRPDCVPDRIQVRPEAGLARLVWQASGALSPRRLASVLASFQDWLNPAGTCPNGAVQIVQAPSPFDELTAAYALPADPVVRSLHAGLKNRYDPGGVLFHPRFPISNPSSSS